MNSYKSLKNKGVIFLLQWGIKIEKWINFFGKEEKFLYDIRVLKEPGYLSS